MQDKKPQDKQPKTVSGQRRENTPNSPTQDDSARQAGQSIPVDPADDTFGPASCLDTLQLAALERSFRQWAKAPRRADFRTARQRVLLAFLLQRHTGARPGEILQMDDRTDMDLDAGTVLLGAESMRKDGEDASRRSVPLPAPLAEEIRALLSERGMDGLRGRVLHLEPAHLRRKYYERADDCGLPRALSSPSAVRRARAAELLREGVPLPVAQRLLGNTPADMPASLVNLSRADADKAARHYLDKESRKKTSARNTFFGIVQSVQRGDVQALVRLTSLGGQNVSSVITLQSLDTLGLRPGSTVTAEIKAPWVIFGPGDTPPAAVDNTFRGTVSRVREGAISAEIALTLDDGTEVCCITTTESLRAFDPRPGSPAWAACNAFSVILTP